MAVRSLAIFVALALVLSSCGSPAPIRSSPSIPPEPTSAAGPAKPQPPPTTCTVTLLAAGDNLIHDVIYNQAARRKPGGYDFAPAYSAVKPLIAAADIAVINQETVLASAVAPVASYPLFCTPVEMGEQLLELGFTVFTQANNHSYDQRAKGIRAAMDFWDKHPQALAVGLYRNAAERETIRYTTVNGIKIAFLAAAEQTNGITLPATATEGVLLLSDDNALRRQLQEAQKNADFVVFSAHWGVEGTDRVGDEQRRMAKDLVGWGADLVLGTHPHVLQPCETITRGDGTEGLVIYSLGNFLSAQQGWANMAGGLLQVTIQKAGENHGTVADYKLIPTITHYDQGYANLRVIPFADYTPQLAADHGVNRYKAGFTLGYLTQLYKKNYPGHVELPAQAAVAGTIAAAPTISKVAHTLDVASADMMLDAICKKFNVAGMSLAAFKNQKVVYTRSYGMRNREKKLPATVDTVYRTASIAKSITSMLALELVDAGTIDLDADISQYTGVTVRNPRYPTDILTTRELMTHTASVVDSGAYYSAIDHTPFVALSQLLQHNIFSAHPPGNIYEYSNLSAGLVGCVAAGASKKPLWELSKERLFDPLGLTTTYLSKTLPEQDKIACIYGGGARTFDPIQDGTAAAYYQKIPPGEMFMLGHGDLYTTASDLAKLGMVLAGDGQVDGVRILQPQTVAAANTLQFHVNPQSTTIPDIYRGLGVQLFPELVQGKSMAGHQGNAYGMIGCLLYLPGGQSGVAFLTNGCYASQRDGVVYDINREVVDAMYQYILDEENL